MEKFNKKFTDFVRKTFLDLREEKEEKDDSFKKTVSDLTQRWNKQKRNLDIKNELIWESVPAFESLIKNLYSEIKEHKYDVIIGEDTSGRIPALVIGGLMKLVYREDNVKEPNLLFLAGYKNEPKTEILGFQSRKWFNKLKRYINELKKINIIKDDSNVLLVTEYMASGDTVESIASFFLQNDINISVASLESFHSAESLNRQGKNFDMHIGKITSDFNPTLWCGSDYYNKDFKMFEKDFKNSGIFVKKPNNRILKANFENIKSIRNDIKVLVKYLFDYYKSINKE